MTAIDLPALRARLEDLRSANLPPAVRTAELKNIVRPFREEINEIERNAHARGATDLLASESRRLDNIKAAADLVHAELLRPGYLEERENISAAVRMANPAVFGASMGTYEREDHEQNLVRAFLDGSGPRQLRVPVAAAMREREAVRSGVEPSLARNSLLSDTGSIGSGVPTLMATQLYEVLEAQVAMLRMPTTKISTPTGGPYVIPKLTTHSIATQVIAQGTAIGGTDPAFDKLTLDAYKYGELVQISSEAITDTSFDVLGLVARDTGRAVGRLVDADLVVGTGTGEPLGVMSAITGSGTVVTGGSLVTPTYEHLVNTRFSVNDEYRNRGNAAWLMRDSTAGTLMKLRDGAGGTIGAPLWQPSTTGGISGYRQPDFLLGDPAYTDVNVAAQGSAAKIIAYGDWSAYYIRHVSDIIFERSDDFAFDKDLVTFRAKWRLDGDLIDTAAINALRMVVA